MEGMIRAHIPTVQGQSESTENAAKTLSTGCGGAVLALNPTEITVSLHGSLLSTVMRDRAVTHPRNVIDSATPGPSRVEAEAGEEVE